MIAPVDISRLPIKPVIGRPGVSVQRPGKIAADDVDDAVRASAKGVAAVPAEAAETVGVAGRVLDAANGVVNTVASPWVVFPAMLGMPVVGALGKGVGKVGKWTRLGFLEKAGRSMTGGVERVSNATFSQLGEKTGIGNTAGRATQAVADRFGGAAQWISDRTGLGERVGSLREGLAHTHLTRAQRTVNQWNIGGAHTDLQPHLSKLQKMVSQASVAHPIDADQFKQVMDKATGALEKEAVAKHSKGIARSLDRLEKSVTKSNGHLGGAKGARNVSQGARNMPKAIAGTSAMHGVLSGAWIGAAALSMFNDARAFGGKLRTLKQMYFDITGNHASTTRILFGDVPTPVREARKNMVKLIGISEVSDAIGIGINVAGARNNNWNMIKQFLAYSIPGWIATGAEGMLGNQIAPAYEALSKAHKAGQPLGADDYAVLLNVASPDLRNKGADNAFTKAVAEQYVAEQANPAMIMREISDGRMMQRVARLIVANEAAQNQAPGTPAVSKERPVVGQHTQQLAKAQSSALEQGV